MKRQHLRLAISIATLTFAISALAYAMVAQKQAADAGTTARVARAAAEAPRKPVTVRVDWTPVKARIERVERDAHEARACADWLLLVVRAVVVAWPSRPMLPSGPKWCPLAFKDGSGELGVGRPGEQREWKGVVLEPGAGAAVERARKAARR